MIDESQFFIIRDIPPEQTSYYGPFDAVEEGTVWHRAKLYGVTGGWRVSFYASDTPDDEPRWSAAYENPADILLHAFKGRYLWVMFIQTAETSARIEEIHLYYPAHSFTRYLPALYQTADLSAFFSRFVAIFQSLYLDLDESIAGFSVSLDPNAAQGDSLSALVSWLGCDEFALLPEEKKRDFLRQCVAWYSRYGTCENIIHIASWLYGGAAFIVEYPDFEPYLSQKKLTDHFGDNPFLFTLLLFRPDDAVSGIKDVVAAVVDKMKPAHTQCQVVEMQKRVKLDEHTYLGFNSYLT